MEGSSDVGLDQGSNLVTPYFTPFQKQAFRTSGLQPVSMDLSPSSGGDSSAASMKEGTGSPSSSSSDSEADGNGHLEGIKLKEHFPDLEEQNQLAGEEKTDSVIWKREDKNYDELLKKFIKNEEELRISNSKLQLSEEEIIKLKIQLEKSEVQLDNVHKELKMKEEDLEYEKGQVLELKNQTAELETHVPDCCDKIAKLVEQLEEAQEQLKESNDEIARLREDLRSKSSSTHQLQGQLKTAQEDIDSLKYQLEIETQEFEDRIARYKANETNHELEVQKLKAEILDSQAQFSVEKDQLISGIVSLTEVKMQLNSRLKEWESRSNELEIKLSIYEAEKLKQVELHASQQRALQDEISSLKEELGLRSHEIEGVNKEFDRHKQNYDMLMTERDGANATIDKLKAELSFRDNQIADVERKLVEIRTQQAELISGSETKLNLVNQLKLKVEELEKEVARQNAVISDRDEQKREAIRQLCFSLEHYRSGYQELVRVFTGHRRHAVTAS
ncbi:protein NETWORKED 4B-like isoform X2 [Lotus japonicus]|nr:protein NETWORKED 4B-like isoform X2 [Lotus japonicus]